MSPYGGKGHHRLRPLFQRRVQRHIAEDAFYQQHGLLAPDIIAHRLSQGGFAAKHTARAALRKENYIRVGQVLRIALQHIQPHDREEQRIAHHSLQLHPPVAQPVVIVKQSTAHRGSLHPVGIFLGYRRRNGNQRIDRLLTLHHSVLQPSGLHLIEFIGLAIEVIETQFKGYPRKEKHGHQQLQRQRNNLDNITACPMGQALNGVIQVSKHR